MRKDENRKLAERIFLDEEGRIANKELAKRLDVHPASIARWRKLDSWDRKLAEGDVSMEDEPYELDFYDVDLRHIRLLNARIDSYLSKSELLTSEIRELAEAKYHIMNCVEIIRDQMTYPVFEEPE
jgi:hypothetical protein